MGLPNTVWNDGRPEEAYQYAVLGLTDKQMAEVMEVDHNTFVYWKRNKPEFLHRLNEGKAETDAKVANALLANCFDRFVEIEEVHVVKGELKRIKVQKFIAGDKWAQKQWLTVRQRALWGESQKIELTQTNININKFDFSGLSNQELMVLKKAGLQQITREIGGN